jgi:O-antigen ligase
MTSTVRSLCVIAVIGISTMGEGGAAASGLLVSHLLLAASVAAFAVFYPRSAYAPSRGPVLAWLCFAAFAAAGAVIAPYAYAAWLILVELIAFGALFWLACGDPSALARVLPAAIAVFASTHGIVALAERISGNPRPASSFLNPNHLAAWLAAAALFLGGTMLAKHYAFRARLLYGAAIVLALSGIFVTGSRGAILGFVAGAAALVAIGFRRLATTTRRAVLAVTLFLVLGTSLGVAVRFRTSDDPYRFHRTRIWAASLQAALRSPFFGVGPGQFVAAAPNLNFPLEDAPLRFERGFSTPHSDVLRAVCEFGFPAALAVLVAVMLAIRELFLRKSELTAVEQGATAALFGLVVQGCVDDLTTRPAITMLGATFAGLLLARPRLASSRQAGCVTAAIISGLVILALGVGELAGFLAWSAVSNLPRGRLDAGQLDRLRRSLFLNPMQPASWQRLAEHFVGDGRSWSLQDYAAAREAVEHAARLQPADAAYTRAAARVEATASLSIIPLVATRERAKTLYDDALAVARTDATIPLEAAKFLLQAGDPAGAERAARRSLVIEPRAAAPRLWLARAILQQERPLGAAEAQRLLDEALRLAPGPREVPSSSYDVALRGVEPELVEALRRELAVQAAR